MKTSCLQVIEEVPRETCGIEPVEDCKYVMKIVPGIEEVEKCIDVPVSDCKLSLVPRTVRQPGIQKICSNDPQPRKI